MCQTVVLYDHNPFDACCDPSICEEPVYSCSGTDCPTKCLPEGTYYAVITLVDEVGLEMVYYAEIVLGPDCDIDVTEGWEIGPPECVNWDSETTDIIGCCYQMCILPY